MVKFIKPEKKEKKEGKSYNAFTPQHKKSDFSHLGKQESSFHNHEKNFSPKSPRRLTIPRGRNS